MHRMLSNLISSTIRQSLAENLDADSGQAHIHVNIATSRADDNNNNNLSPSSGPSLSSSTQSNAQIWPQLFSHLIGSGGAGLPPNVGASSLGLDQPLSELMQLIGADDTGNNASTSESTLGLFNVLVQSLSIGDMLNLARGQNRATIFERARSPLRAYLRQNHQISGLSEQDHARRETLVENLYADMFIRESTGGLHLNLERLFVVEGASSPSSSSMDWPRSFEKLAKAHLTRLIEHMLSDDDGRAQTSTSTSTVTWSQGLFARLDAFLAEMVSLARVYVGGSSLRAMSSVADERIVEACVRQLREMIAENGGMRGVGGMLVFFEGFVQSKVQQVLLGINLERSVVEPFIVYKEKEKESEKVREKEAEVSVTDQEDQYDSASSTLSGASLDIEQHFARHREQVEAKSGQIVDEVEGSTGQTWVICIFIIFYCDFSERLAQYFEDFTGKVCF